MKRAAIAVVLLVVLGACHAGDGQTSSDASALIGELWVYLEDAWQRPPPQSGLIGFVGLVVAQGGVLVVLGAAFQRAAREALARPRTAEHDDLPPEARRVMDAFVVDGRLQQIPTAHAKRLVVLDWLAQSFEPGQRYSEAQVNLILGQRHADTAALRRYLVDEGFLSRDAGQYWRSGGST